MLPRRRRVVLSAVPIQGFPGAGILVAELKNRLQDLDSWRLGRLVFRRRSFFYLRFWLLFDLEIPRGRRGGRFRFWLIGLRSWLIGRRHERDVYRLLLLRPLGWLGQAIDQERDDKRMQDQRCGQGPPQIPTPVLCLVLHPD